MRHNIATELETNRANLAKEVETNRSNLAQEAEAKRSNQAREYETNRANIAREEETHRSNVMNEAIMESNARTNAMNALSNRISASASASQASTAAARQRIDAARARVQNVNETLTTRSGSNLNRARTREITSMLPEKKKLTKAQTDETRIKSIRGIVGAVNDVIGAGLRLAVPFR